MATGFLPIVLLIVGLVLGLALGWFLGSRPIDEWRARHAERDGEGGELVASPQPRRLQVQLPLGGQIPFDANFAPARDFAFSERALRMQEILSSPCWSLHLARAKSYCAFARASLASVAAATVP